MAVTEEVPGHIPGDHVGVGRVPGGVMIRPLPVNWEAPTVFCVYGADELRRDVPELSGFADDTLGPVILRAYEAFVAAIMADKGVRKSNGERPCVPDVTDIVRDRELHVHNYHLPEHERPILYIVDGQAVQMGCALDNSGSYGGPEPIARHISFGMRELGAFTLRTLFRKYVFANADSLEVEAED